MCLFFCNESSQRNCFQIERVCGKHLSIRDQGKKLGIKVPGRSHAWALQLWEGVTWGACMGPCWEQSPMGQHGQSAGSAPEHSAEVDASCVHWMGFPDGYVCLSGAITASGKLLLYWKLAVRES